MRFIRKLNTASLWLDKTRAIAKLLRCFEIDARGTAPRPVSVYSANSEIEELEAVSALFQVAPSTPEKLHGLLIDSKDCEGAGVVIDESAPGKTGIGCVDRRHMNLLGDKEQFIRLISAILARIWEGEHRLRTYSAHQLIGQIGIFSRLRDSDIHAESRAQCHAVLERWHPSPCKFLDHPPRVEICGEYEERLSGHSIVAERRIPGGETNLKTHSEPRPLAGASNLVVEDLVKEFPTRSEPLIILRGVSLALAAGENLAILGPSGSGKSTLLHVVGTLDSPTSGKVRLGGQDPFELAEPALARFRNRNIGFIFQEHHLLPQLTVLENVLVPALAEGRPDKPLVERAHELLSRVGLSERLDHRPAELSGGERQRVAVARALLLRPALLLGDEPTGSLDRANALAVGKLLLELQQQEQNMLIVVTHSAEIGELLQRRMEINNGLLKNV